MTKPIQHRFSRRERQIMDAVFSLEEATVNQVVDHLNEPEAYDSVRVTMGILEKKGYLTHRQEGGRNVYRATIERQKAQRSAMRHLLETFFDGSSRQAILAFLDMSGEGLSDKELDEIARRVDRRLEDDDDGDDGEA